MALSDYKPASRVVSLGNNTSVEVKGLSLTEITLLIRKNLATIKQVYSSANVGEDFDIDSLLSIAMVDAPEIITDIIMLGCGESDESAREKAKSLPGPVQLLIISDIITLTFDEVGGVKKFLELVRTMLTRLK